MSLTRVLLTATGTAALALGLTACGDDRNAADAVPEVRANTTVDTYSLQPIADPPPAAGIEDVMDPEAMSAALTDLPPDTEPVRDYYPAEQGGGPQGRGFMCDGKPVGDWVYWHQNGQVSMRGYYVYGGLQEGTWITYDTDGSRLSYGNYEHGDEHGDWWYWNSGGSMSMHGSYHNGLKNGRWTAFHANGVRASEGDFSKGRRSGTWRFWSPQGVLTNISTFHVELEPKPGDDLPPLP